jgi:cyanophycin synthetase
MRELGRVAARFFDEVIVREDVHTRGRDRGETGSLVMQGIDEARAQGARVGSAELITDELDACRSALDRSRPGDLVVLCVDRAAEVWDEIEDRRSAGR